MHHKIFTIIIRCKKVYTYVPLKLWAYGFFHLSCTVARSFWLSHLVKITINFTVNTAAAIFSLYDTSTTYVWFYTHPATTRNPLRVSWKLVESQGCSAAGLLSGLGMMKTSWSDSTAARTLVRLNHNKTFSIWILAPRAEAETIEASTIVSCITSVYPRLSLHSQLRRKQ